MPGIFRRIEGRHGRIDVPRIGALVGNIASWTATRRADQGPESDFYDLHAVLVFVNQALWDDREYPKRVMLQRGKGRSFVVEPQEGPGQRTALSGRSLVMERVVLNGASGSS